MRSERRIAQRRCPLPAKRECLRRSDCSPWSQIVGMRTLENRKNVLCMADCKPRDRADFLNIESYPIHEMGLGLFGGAEPRRAVLQCSDPPRPHAILAMHAAQVGDEKFAMLIESDYWTRFQFGRGEICPSNLKYSTEL